MVDGVEKMEVISRLDKFIKSVEGLNLSRKHYINSYVGGLLNE